MDTHTCSEILFCDIETSIYLESLYHEKKIPEMYSVAKNVTSVEGIVFEKDNSRIVELAKKIRSVVAWLLIKNVTCGKILCESL